MVRALIEMMGAGGISELNLAVGRFTVRLRGAATGAATVSVAMPVEIAPATESSVPAADEYLITAPMIGTYYATPTPADPHFVRIGDRVEVGQVVAIIEAMKIMNEIAADRDGTVVEILVVNAQAVEYGSPLLRIVVDMNEDASA